MDTLGDTSLPSSPPGSATDIRASYDDLRRVNRAEHEKKRYESESRPLQLAPSEPVTQPQELPKPRKSYLRVCSALQLVVCSDIFSIQGRLNHYASCTMGGGPRRQGPPDHLPIFFKFLPRCFDV